MAEPRNNNSMAELDDDVEPQIEEHGRPNCQPLFFDECSLCPEINTKVVFDVIEREEDTGFVSLRRVGAYLCERVCDIVGLPISGLKEFIAMIRAFVTVQNSVSMAVAHQNSSDMSHLCVKVRSQLRPSANGGPRIRLFPQLSIFRVVNLRLCNFLFKTSWKHKLVETASSCAEKAIGGDGEYIFTAVFDCFNCAAKFFGTEHLCRVQADVCGVIFPRYVCTGYTRDHAAFDACQAVTGLTAPVPEGVVLRALRCTTVHGVQYMLCAVKKRYNSHWPPGMNMLYTARVERDVGVVNSLGGGTGFTRHCDVLCHCVWVPRECMVMYKHGICQVRYDTRSQFLSVRFEPTIVNDEGVIQGE